jgi:polysaccharide export outer membrane protein
MRFSNGRHLLGGLVMLLVTGCAAMPAPGPTVRDISDGAGASGGYALVRLSPEVMPLLAQVKAPSLVETFGDVEPAPIQTIGIGDVVSVAIWDAGGGLFSQQPSPSVSAQSLGSTNLNTQTLGTQTTLLPSQVVDPDGNISVPFIGQLHVADKSTIAAQAAIVRGLAQQTLRPQALVTVVTAGRNFVTVIGRVKNPGRVLLSVSGTRALDAIALTGGTLIPEFDSLLQLTRKGVTKRVPLSTLLARPSENIYLHPDDLLYVVHDPRAVTVLGAAKNNSRVEFDAEQVTLAEGLGLAGGLVDLQSEPAGVYVFRFESPAMVASLTNQPPPVTDDGRSVPVIFRADLRQPQDFFLAQSFQLQNKDIIYVANAESVQVDKVLRILLHAAGIASAVANRNGIVSSVE